MKHNWTTRKFARSFDEAFEPDNVTRQKQLQQGAWMEHHTTDYEGYLNIAYAFAAGFIVAMLVFGA